MRFEQALQAMREGKIIREQDCPFIIFALSDDEQFWWKNTNDNEDVWEVANFTTDEILAEDWEVVTND